MLSSFISNTNWVNVGTVLCLLFLLIGTFDDTNVERKRCMYDINLTWFENADWTSTRNFRKRRQSYVIHRAFKFYVCVTKGPYFVIILLVGGVQGE